MRRERSLRSLRLLPYSRQLSYKSEYLGTYVKFVARKYREHYLKEAWPLITRFVTREQNVLKASLESETWQILISVRYSLHT